MRSNLHNLNRVLLFISALMMFSLFSCQEEKEGEYFEFLEGTIAYGRRDRQGVVVIREGGKKRSTIFGHMRARKPHLSADGQRLAFAGSAESMESGVYFGDTEGQDYVTIAQWGGIWPPGLAALSPDGEWVFIGYLNGTLFYSLIKTDKSESYPCPEELLGVRTFSPDGKQVASITSADINIIDIEVEGCEVGQFKTITNTPEVWERYLDWSPLGDKLVFTMPEEDGAYNVYTIDVDGNNLTKLTHYASGKEVKHPAWSPSGTMLVYELDGNLIVIREDGTEIGTIVSDGMAEEPDWAL